MKYSIETKQEIAERYKAGESSKQLAVAYDITGTTVVRWLAELGVPRRTHSESLTGRFKSENRICTYCRRELSIGNFCTSKTNARGVSHTCKDCRGKHPRHKSMQRNYRLKRDFGIDHAEYERMLASQGGRCAICGTTDPGHHSRDGHFCIDHDHRTGEVRKLLCHKCNTMLGIVDDDQEWLAKAIKYLSEH